MPFFSNLKNKTVRTSKRLIGYDQIRTGTVENYSVFKNIAKYNLTKNTDPEGDVYLSKEAVAEAQKSFKKLVVIFLFLFITGLLYSLISFFTISWTLGLVALAFSTVCLAFAFRYHFWLYQIKNHTLGATFGEYYRAEIKGFLNKKGSSTKKDNK